MSSSIEKPIRSKDIGTFNHIAYKRHYGKFVGGVGSERFVVPYRITAPANVAEGNRTVVFEPPHFSGGPVARNVYLGRESLFGAGFMHASVGYSNLSLRILHRKPDYTPEIYGRPITLIDGPPGQSNEVTDPNILREFALALKQSPPSVVGQVKRIYAMGFSDSGKAVHKAYEPYGHKLFDLSLACTASYIAPVQIPGQNPIIVFNTEADFDKFAIPNPKFPQYRWYTMAGGPHIPDASLTREVFKGEEGPAPPIAGTSPINWLPMIRALLIAGDQWVRQGKQPPPSACLTLNPLGQIARDAAGNALGGIRHPALVAGEATFIASVVRENGWDNFGGYKNPRRVADCDFPQYLESFTNATEALLAARFLLPAGRDRLIREAQLQPPNTFTLNYQEGRLL